MTPERDEVKRVERVIGNLLRAMSTNTLRFGPVPQSIVRAGADPDHEQVFWIDDEGRRRDVFTGTEEACKGFIEGVEYAGTVVLGWGNQN